MKKITETSSKKRKRKSTKRAKKKTGPDPMQICAMTLYECKKSNTVLIEVLGDIPYYTYVSKVWWNKNSDSVKYKFIRNGTV